MALAQLGRDWRRRWGVVRSLLIYYAKPLQLRRMTRFYASLIRPGDLCFDIGAHVGNRVHVWRRLGARVVAVEPQPQCIRVLQSLYGQDRGVTLVTEAVAAQPGTQILRISSHNPTVSTLSQGWIDAVRRMDSFAGVEWSEELAVSVTTLDLLIARHGNPAYCKIDVEGYESAVLAGLSQPLPLISFEFIPAARTVALDALTRLEELGDYRYNWFMGERHRWEEAQWVDAATLRTRLAAMPDDGPSGDIFARLVVPSHAQEVP
jgi:FkbM family methyltransferase